MVVKNERRRYILLEFMNELPEIQKFNKELRKIYGKLNGEFSLARSGLHIIPYNQNYLIVRCNHLCRDKVEASLAIIKKIGIFRIKTVTGTIKSIDRKLEDEDFED